jgi:[acyl-carrier-protein] S-malonyltransferase
MPVNAFIFPGQGSQAVGMGRDLAAAFAAAREVFEEVDETLKQKLSKLMFVLKLRGQSMQKAVPAGMGAMAALLGVDMEQARAICAEAAPVPETGTTEIVQPANDNGAGQVVISGHRTAIERAIEIAKTKGVKRAMLLPVSAPFHCALMAPAADAMAEALETTPPRAPCVPLVANVSAKRESDPGQIRDLLVQQVTATVRWRECVTAMTEMGVDRFIELGAGKVLTGLIKRIAPDASGMAAGTPGEIEAVLKNL